MAPRARVTRGGSGAPQGWGCHPADGGGSSSSGGGGVCVYVCVVCALGMALRVCGAAAVCTVCAWCLRGGPAGRCCIGRAGCKMLWGVVLCPKTAVRGGCRTRHGGGLACMSRLEHCIGRWQQAWCQDRARARVCARTTEGIIS
jgi:hypothetical protein